MLKQRKLLTIFATLVLILSCVTTCIIIKSSLIKNKDKELSKIENDSKNLDPTKLYKSFHEEAIDIDTIPNEDYNPEIKYSAWIAHWDFKRGLESYRVNPKAFYSLSPTWYYLKPDGSLGLKATARNLEIKNLCKENSTKLIPSISNSNSEELSNILNDENLLNSHINSIVNEVINYEYDGIDIDYEIIKASDKDKFSMFIKYLATKLHENNKILTVAILWKNNLAPIIDNFNESRAAQDWKEISKHVDEFRIMAYDYTGSSDLPGPIAPREWIRSILDYAMENVTKQEKIALGLPLYAYEWTENTKGAKALVYNDIENIRNLYQDFIDEFDNDNMESKLTYNQNGKVKVIWYQDSKVTKKRIELAKTYGVDKFVFWRLGGEDKKIFNIN